MQITLKSKSPSQTEAIGQKIGRRLKGGEVIDVKSDLGGGKTTLVRGIANGAGSTDKVASPSFTISKVYKSDNLSIYHFDFYRLDEPGLMQYEIIDLLKNPKAVLVIEWSDLIKDILPEDRLSIEIIAKSEDSRELKISYPENLTYLVGDL